MKRTTHFLSLVTTLFLTACSPALDGTSASAYEQSLKAVNASVPENERLQFFGQLATVVKLRRYDLRKSGVHELSLDDELRSSMDGMTAKQIIREAETRQSDLELIDRLREQVGVGLSETVGLRMAIQEFYMEMGEMPKNEDEAGTDWSGVYGSSSSVLSSVVMSMGGLGLTFRDDLHEDLSGSVLMLTATPESAGRIGWNCTSLDMALTLYERMDTSYERLCY